MAAQGYEFYLRVLKVSLTSEKHSFSKWFVISWIRLQSHFVSMPDCIIRYRPKKEAAQLLR